MAEYETVGHLSACPSVPSFGRHKLLWQVCCCGPGGWQILIDCCMAGGQHSTAAAPQHGMQLQMWAVPQSQLT